MPSQVDENLLLKAIQSLQRKQDAHLQLGDRMKKADGGNVFLMDILAAAVLNRSVRLVKGFCEQIGTNFMCAAPLVRLQLDNVLRFRAAKHVVDLNEFVLEIMRGIPIRKLKDRNGKLMSDAHLVEEASAEFPPIKDIYERGCGYIHLCEVHIGHAIRASGHMQVDLTISLEDHEITNENRSDAIGAMAYVTDLVLIHVGGWVQTKANPELILDPMKRAETLLERGQVGLAKEWLEIVAKDHYDPTVVAVAKARLASL